ncbi:MAG: hypothetical protein KAH54_11825 [Candidatus Sabulitectum sp.]|nr:hypothetical protein [Candidatus Sabulitectum sp.]
MYGLIVPVCLIASVAISQVAPVEFWENAYSAAGYGYTVAHDVCPAHGTGMVIAGSCFSQDMEINSHIYILKLDETGTVVWENTYQITSNDVNIAWGISQTSSGYVLAGETGDSQNQSAFIATINPDGNNFTSGTIQGECAVEAIQMENQLGYIVLGQTDTEQDRSFVFIDKVDNFLTQIPRPAWNRWVHTEFGESSQRINSYSYCNSIVEIPSAYGPDMGNHIALCFGRGNENTPANSMVGLLHPQGTVLVSSLEASSTGAGYF